MSQPETSNNGRQILFPKKMRNKDGTSSHKDETENWKISEPIGQKEGKN